MPKFMVRYSLILVLASVVWCQPSYFAVAGAVYDHQAIPSVALGAKLTGNTYALITAQVPVRGLGHVDIEACQHLAQDRRLGLWAILGGSVPAGTPAITGAQSGAVSFGLFASVKLWGAAFWTSGVRFLAPLSNTTQSGLEKQILGGIGYEFR